MAFQDEQIAEIRRVVAETLGLEEGQKVTDLIQEAAKDTANAIVNAYDRRARKEREKIESTLAEIAERLQSQTSSPGEGNPSDSREGDGMPDTGSLPPEARNLVESLRKANEKLASDMEAMRKHLEKEREERERIQKERELEAQMNAVRQAALSKDVGFDPALVDILIDHIDRRGLIRKGESGYEMKLPEPHPVTGEEQWAPIGKAMQAFAKTDVGKRFRPAVQGASPDAGSSGSGQTSSIPDDAVRLRAADITSGKVDPKTIREALEKGLVIDDQ